MVADPGVAGSDAAGVGRLTVMVLKEKCSVCGAFLVKVVFRGWHATAYVICPNRFARRHE